MEPHNVVKENGKISLFSCMAGVEVCMGTNVMNITCFIQKLSRFEVLLSKVISKWSTEKNFVYGLSYEVSPMFITLPISNPPVVVNIGFN